MRSRLTPLVKLLYNPLQAMMDLRARAPYALGSVLALVASLPYYNSHSGGVAFLLLGFNSTDSVLANLLLRVYASIPPVLFLAVVFIPACLVAANIVDRRSSLALLLRQEYASFASCVLYSWAVTHLVALAPAWLLLRQGAMDSKFIEAARQLVPLPFFILLVIFALRAVLSLSFGRAAVAVALGAISLAALPILPGLLFILSSPFLMILVILFLINFFGNVLNAQRAREEFKQNLEAATLNPADWSAHYNLGLIYQQRGQYEEAKSCYQRAIEIAPDEIDSHYQLGRIAREEGRLSEAINHFDQVVRLDAEHSQSEVWREIGRAYFQAEQFADARTAFERFLGKRPSNAEGRYRYGLTLHRLGLSEDAAAEMRACIEAVRTAPAYKYRTDKRWMNEAQSFLRSL